MSRQDHHHPVHPLAAWHRLGIDLTGSLLLLTGVGWLGLHYTLGAGSGQLPHPLEAWFLRLHGLVADAGLFVLGIVAAAHVPLGWRLTRRPRWAHQRRTGLTLCLLGASLAVTGYLLYYFAPEWFRPPLGWAHAVAGVAMAVVMTLHRRRVWSGSR
jgi:hypothetical protein